MIRYGKRKIGFTPHEVRNFKRAWPASGLSDRAFWFEFDATGDLVDTDVPHEQDNSAASALADDARNYLIHGTVPEYATEPESKETYRIPVSFKVNPHKTYSLTDKQRSQILSAYDAGWGFAKIARVVECSVKEVKAVIAANRTNMRDNPVSLDPQGANRTVLTLDDGVRVFFSYKTPVAAWFPDNKQLLVTDKTWSRTTSKHIGQFAQSLPSISITNRKPQAYFDTLATGIRNNPRSKTDFANEMIRSVHPEAACPRCGGWTTMGGMSQYAHLRGKKVYGRSGCTCTDLTRKARLLHGDPSTIWESKQGGVRYSTNDPKGEGYRYVGLRPDGLHLFVNSDGKKELFAASTTPPASWHLIRGNRYYEFVRSNPQGKHMARRKVRASTRRSVVASTRTHPYFSKLPVHVQERQGNSFKTVAAFIGTPTGIARAKQYAKIWKRQRGRVQVRVIDIR